MSRETISKKLRFDVFKRDGFVCVYCGAHPPEALMEVDHVLPVASGGPTEITNLVTACFDCNRCKGAGLLSAAPQSVAEQAEIAAERESQVRAYYQILEDRKERRDSELWAVAEVFMERFGDDSIQRSRLASIRMFLDRLPYFDVLEAMEIAADKHYSKGPVFKYFCGICWRKIKRANGEE
jgi:hypothetical protein